VTFLSFCSPHSFNFHSIGAATEIVDLPGFHVRIIPTADSLFNVSKLNVSTRNNVRAYTKGNTTDLHMFNSIVMLISFLVL
jgi:hypothetical protein